MPDAEAHLRLNMYADSPATDARLLLRLPERVSSESRHGMRRIRPVSARAELRASSGARCLTNTARLSVAGGALQRYSVIACSKRHKGRSAPYALRLQCLSSLVPLVIA